MRMILLLYAFCFLLSCNSSTGGHEERYLLEYENGKKFCEGVYLVYDDGDKTKVGQWKYYFPNGDLKSLVEYDEENFLGYKYYNEGGVLTESFSKKERLELFSEFYDNGNLKNEIVITIDEDGIETEIQKEYYSNGQLMTLKEFEDGIQIKKEKVWNKFGTLVLELDYQDGEIVNK